MSLPRIPGDQIADQHIATIQQLCGRLPPHLAKIVVDEIRRQAGRLDDLERTFYTDIMEQRVLVSIRTTSGNCMRIRGANWPTEPVAAAAAAAATTQDNNEDTSR